IGLISHHEPCPLMVAHRRSSAVGEQIDVDAVRRDRENIEAGRAYQPFALVARNAPERFDHLDSERFRWESHGGCRIARAGRRINPARQGRFPLRAVATVSILGSSRSPSSATIEAEQAARPTFPPASRPPPSRQAASLSTCFAWPQSASTHAAVTTCCAAE